MPTSRHKVKKSSPPDSTSIVESQSKRQTRSQTKQLIRAFESLDIERANELIFRRGIDPSIMDSALLARSLWHAVKTQNTPLARELLKYQPQLTTNDDDDEAMLMLAIDNLDVEMARMLINAGADVNENDYLRVVASCGDATMHELAAPLMERGADVRARDRRGRSILECALKHEALGVVEELLRRGVRIRDDGGDEMILSTTASTSKSAEMLALLFKYNCIGIEARDKWCLTAIFNLIERESDRAAEIVRLLDLGVSIDQTNEWGVTALHYAVSREKPKTVELLLNHGADVNKKTHRGTTPIMLAVASRKSTIVALLVERGANIHDCDNSARYPIHIACQTGFSPNIRLLIHLGADVHMMDQWDFTPFSLLRDASSAENIDIFLKHFALLTASGSPFNVIDLATIQSDEYMSTAYNACVKELQRMKNAEFTSGVNYFDLISGKIEKLSILAKNAEFAEQFRKDQRNAKGRKFRWLKYRTELAIAFQMAEKCRDLLIAKEAMLRKICNDIFPRIVLDKIARYLVFGDFSNFKKTFYLSLLPNDDGKSNIV